MNVLPTAKSSLFSAGLWLAEDPRRLSAAAALVTALAGIIAFLAGASPTLLHVAPSGGGGGGGMG